MQIGTATNSHTVASNKKITPTISGSTAYKPYKIASTKMNTGIGVQKYLKTQPDLDQSANITNGYNHNNNNGKGNNNLQPGPSYLSTQYSGLANIQVGGATTKSKDLLNGKYEIEGVAGKGTFGVVYFGRNFQTSKKIALKKVLQDKKYKNR